MGTYYMEESVNGEAVEGQQVDADFVKNFTSAETRRFFTNLGGTERISRNNKGVVRCKSTSPDGGRVRIVTFVPIRD